MPARQVQVPVPVRLVPVRLVAVRGPRAGLAAGALLALAVAVAVARQPEQPRRR